MDGPDTDTHTHTHTHTGSGVRKKLSAQSVCKGYRLPGQPRSKQKRMKKRRQQAIFGTQSEVVRAKLEQTCLKAANWAEFIPAHTHTYTPGSLKKKTKKNLLKAELTNKQNANKKTNKIRQKIRKN